MGQSRRLFLRTLAGGTMAAALRPGLLMAGAAAGKTRPNILYIMSDDHASHAISAYGSKINKTPNIDRIAAGGMRLNNCFCTNSICTPSRAAILTGQYSHVNGVYTLADPLDPERRNVAKLLQQAGYETAMVGKWHLHKDPTGFDYWNILPGQGRYHDPIMMTPENRKQVHKGYATDIITDFSLEFLKKRDLGRPFFLMCHHKAPHRAWDPDEKHMSLYANEDVPEPDNLYDHYENRSNAAEIATMRVGEHMSRNDVKEPIPKDLKGDALRKWAYQRYIKNYLRCIASVDDNVGRLLDYLDKEDLAQNTIVIYTSDQGFFLGDHGWYDKRFMLEESLRMPFLVRYPAEIKPGSVNDDMILNIDFAPTFLEYARAAVPSDMQGRGFRSNLAGLTPGDWRQSMYYRYWMHLADHGVPAHYGVRTKRHKLIHYYGQPLGKRGAVKKPTEPEWEMFDLEKDPREMRNVVDDPAYAETVKQLKAELYRLKELYRDTE